MIQRKHHLIWWDPSILLEFPISPDLRDCIPHQFLTSTTTFCIEDVEGLNHLRFSDGSIRWATMAPTSVPRFAASRLGIIDKYITSKWIVSNMHMQFDCFFDMNIHR